MRAPPKSESKKVTREVKILERKQKRQRDAMGKKKLREETKAAKPEP
jgi:hypothetical protein